MIEEQTSSENRTPGCLQRREIGPPQVFISSTFEDLLSDIRDQLRSELEAANLLPLMSELGDFKYTYQNASVMTDTIQAAATSDFYVLVIGRRFGTLADGHHSVTELEYAAARQAGVPTLVYVQEKVWEGYEAFRAGAVGDSKHWVDDDRVFRFITRVAAVDAHRCRPFLTGREIIDDFRHQVANLLGGFLRFEARATHWLWTEEYTRQVEQNAKVVWILTPNFYWDYTDPHFRRLVYENVMIREVTYYYLYCDSAENNRRAAEMVGYFHDALGDDRWRAQVHYAAIPADEFNWCAEQAMYDPGYGDRERGIIVDIMDERDKINKTNIELGREKRADFRRQFVHLWHRHGSGPILGALEGKEAVTRPVTSV